MASKSTIPQFPTPPEAKSSLRRVALRVTAPVEQLLHQQTTSGFLLLGMAVIALVWANSPWADSYVHLWHTEIGFSIGGFEFAKPLQHFWINDFLMTFFFMAAGFEIKREMAEGELSDIRRGALPIAAAVGGMLVPASIYFLFNSSGPMVNGWGVPMATDIAFALGIMLLLGDRVPSALRILLLALAIIDDVGAIIVIAVFYTSNFDITGLYIVGGGLVVLYFFRTLGIRPGLLYSIPLVIIFTGLYQAGIHPTIAGVIVGMSAPVKPWLSKEQFLAISRGIIDDFQRETGKENWNEDDLIEPLKRLGMAGREVVAPVVRLQNAFHPWVAFFIMPAFALANAGVELGEVKFGDPLAFAVMLGVALGLGVGKPIGVMGVSWLLVRFNVVKLPRGVTWRGMLIMGLCAGIGFTMAIFIASLAFKTHPDVLGMSKLAILSATAVTGTLAMVVGRVILPRELDPDVAATTPAQAEASTEY
ncbi:Na+/H+ antiporter NhaA [Haliangium sp.]|uniref:Na+/H+ antiporter NhaA n=1 Tax=Haliangium sp. TaxID=2663208 RepID=UPI003D144FAB